MPTIAEEDAKQPNRERDCLVGERTRIVNRIKSTLARLGIRNFKPTLRKAAERLAAVHTPEGMLPPNTLAELQRLTISSFPRILVGAMPFQSPLRQFLTVYSSVQTKMLRRTAC